MFRVIVEKKCPECGIVQNFPETVSLVQKEWLESHPIHPINCESCGHYGLSSRCIDLSVVRSKYESGSRLDDIAKDLCIRVTTAAQGLTLDQKVEWKKLRKTEIAAEKERIAADKKRKALNP